MTRSLFPRRRSIRAFTLVELLVVIGVIALLISILLPALNKARQQAARVKCLANMRQVYTELRLYANNYRDMVPIGYNFSNKSRSYTVWEPISSTSTGRLMIFGYMFHANFMKSPLVYYCPSEEQWSFMFNQRSTTSGFQNQWPPARWGSPGSPPSGNAWANQGTRIGYSSRPEIRWYDHSGSALPDYYQTGLAGDCRMPKFTQLKNKALLTERLNLGAIDRRHKIGMNVVYADGAGIFVRTGEFQTNLANFEATSNNAYILNDPEGYAGANNSATTPLQGVWVDLDRLR